MKNKKKFEKILVASAIMQSLLATNPFGLRNEKPKNKTQKTRKIVLQKGLKVFKIKGVEINALNLKNAVRKYDKKLINANNEADFYKNHTEPHF